MSRKSAFVLWLALAMAVTVVLGSINWVDLFRLDRQSATTAAIITAIEPSNHGAISYEFTVAGRPFHGSQASTAPLVFGVGQATAVYYLPQDPRVSVLGSPREKLRNETLSILSAGVLLPAFTVFAVYKRFNRTRIANAV